MIWLLPLCAAAIAYLPARSGQLVWDDQLVLEQQIDAFDSLADVFAPPANIPDWQPRYYRPLVVASYLFDQAAFGRGATTGPHLTNVVLHVLATLFVWLLASRLLHSRENRSLGALAAALFFAVHPIHTESVSWVTGRSDLLATVLLLPALWLALGVPQRRAPLAYGAMGLCYFSALLAKEVAIAGLVLVPLLAWRGGARAGHGRLRHALLTGLVLAIATTLWWFMRAAGSPAGAADLPPLADGARRIVQATGWYLGKLVWPWPQSNFVTVEQLPSVTRGGAIVALAAVAATVWWWRSRTRNVLAIGFAITLVALAPSLAVIAADVAVTPVAERYLYLPSVGLALLVGAAVVAPSGALARPIAVAALGLGTLVLGTATYARGLVWQTDVGLWTDATAQAPRAGLAWAQRAKAHLRAGQQADAYAAFLKARELETDPRGLALINYNIGAYELQTSRFLLAEESFRRALAADPSLAIAQAGLATTMFSRASGMGDVREPVAREAQLRAAMQQFERVLAANPELGQARVGRAQAATMLGELLVSLDRPADAAAAFREAVDELAAAARLSNEPGTIATLEHLRERPEQALKQLAQQGMR